MNLDGAVIDSSVIGGTTAAAGTFTTLTASGDLTVDTSTLKVDSTNNRVGIGTASPSAELDITGTGEDISVRINAPTGYDAELKFANNGTTAFTLGHDDATDNFVIGTANVDTNQRFVIDSSGNVGIGTSSPNAAEFSATPNGVLEVEGTKPVVYLSETDTTDAHGWLGVSNGVTYLGSTGGGLQIRTGTDSASTKVTVDTSGQVGIGTTTPASGLHLTGGDNTAAKLTFTNSANSNTYSIHAQNNAQSLNFQEDGTNVMSLATGAKLGIGDSPTNLTDEIITITSPASGGGQGIAFKRLDSNTDQTVGQIRFSNNSTDDLAFIKVKTDGANTSSAMQFFTNTGSASTERLRIDSSGRVGIGTASPARELTVQKSGDSAVIGVVSGTSNLSGMVMGDTSDDDRGAVLYNNSGDYMYFQVDASERARIDSSGNVGIGTTSPSQLLHISSTGSAGILLEADSDNVNEDHVGEIQITQDGGATYSEFGINNSNVAYWNVSEFHRFSRQGSEIARIDTSGNLLVGTTSTSINSSNFGICLFADGRPKFSKNVSGASHVMNVYGNAGEFRVFGDGDVQNTNNSYGQISDISLKENIVDATDKLNEINQVRIRNFNFIGDDLKQIGVIAQELETIFPSMVKTTPDTDSDGNDLGTETKSVKYSVFVPILIKALQEADDKIDALEARITALES